MNTLVALAIAPFGVGEELAPYVAQAVKVIRDSGLPNRTYSMFTEIEGEYDEVMRVVKDATFVLAEAGIRTELILKADIRPGFTDTMNAKVRKVDDILGSGAGAAGAFGMAGAAGAFGMAGATGAVDDIAARACGEAADASGEATGKPDGLRHCRRNEGK